jgi:hypothetical protein
MFTAFNLYGRNSPLRMLGAGYKGFTFLVCPVSRTILDDEAAHPEKSKLLL